MDNLNSKKKKTVLFSLAFLTIFTGILLVAEWYLFMRDIREDGLFKADSIRKTILSYQSEFKETEEQFYGKLNDNVRLSVFILNKLIDGGEYTGRTVFDDGMIVQVKNGRTELPSGGDAIFPDLETEDLTPEYTPKLFTTADGRDVLVTTGRILDGVYYLDWTDYEEYREFFYSRIEVQRLLNFMADAYGGEIFLILDDVPKGAVLLGTDESEAFSNIGELALRQKDHNNREFSLNTKSDRYICYVMPLEGTERTVVYCDTVTDEVQTGLHRAFTKVIFSGCFLAALLVFCFSSITGIKYGLISEKRSPEYTPKKMKQKILLISLLSGLALMFITIFTTFVQESHHENRKGISILDSLELQLSESDHRREMANQTEINWYQYYAKSISAKITDSPQILDKESLSGIAQIINADLIMAFDENGIETVSSSDYIGFTLDDDTKDQDTSDLKKLLKGIPAVIRGPEPDFITGQEHYIIGVPYQLAERAGYGALLFFIDPSAFTNEDEGAEIRRIYSNLTTGEELIMEIDPETFDILSSSDPQMVKSKIRDLDLNEQDLQENKLDIFAHDNVLYYGISRTIRERIWYYAEKISGIVISSLVYSAITSLIFVIICLLTGRCAMNGYTQAYFEECLSANRNAAQAADNRSTPVFLSDMKPLTKADIARKKNRYSPVNKTVTVLWVLCGLAMLILLAAGFLSKNAALAFYVTGSWQRGINPFAFTAIAVIVCIGRLLLIGLDKLFSLIILEMPDKGKTIAQLVHSLLRFVVIIGLFYNCLTYLGVNTRALLASVGIFSLALSLGAKDLVSDILAGLGIVIEEQFQTGEIVEIGGYKGFVDEIGIRSTKIRSFGTNNIKTINNSEIHNVINYSRELSMFFVKIDLPVFLPLDMVKEYLERELPLIREEIPAIISGPSFTGISAIDRNHMTISISGQCREADAFFITKDINMKIKERIDRLVDYKYK